MVRNVVCAGRSEVDETEVRGLARKGQCGEGYQEGNVLKDS